jgi:hypothetical protein
MAYKGKFSPKNPQKYRGDYTNIVYRSTWECRVMTWLDGNESIIEWSSEEIVIPYKSPVDNRVHRYFPDFYVKVKQKDDTIRVQILEVKPHRQTMPPEKKKKKVTKQYINEVVTWSINQAKWRYAIEFCKERKWEFCVMSSTNGIDYVMLKESQLLLT